MNIFILFSLCASLATGLVQEGCNKLVGTSPVRQNLSVLSSPNVCSRQLEEIIYSPPSAAKDYLAKISLEMRANIHEIMAALIANNYKYLQQWVNKYNIVITASGPFPFPVLVTSDYIASVPPLFIASNAQTFAGRDGFYLDSQGGYYNYQFTVWTINAEYMTFVLSLPLSSIF